MEKESSHRQQDVSNHSPPLDEEEEEEDVEEELSSPPPSDDDGGEEETKHDSPPTKKKKTSHSSSSANPHPKDFSKDETLAFLRSLDSIHFYERQNSGNFRTSELYKEVVADLKKQNFPQRKVSTYQTKRTNLEKKYRDILAGLDKSGARWPYKEAMDHLTRNQPKFHPESSMISSSLSKPSSSSASSLLRIHPHPHPSPSSIHAPVLPTSITTPPPHNSSSSSPISGMSGHSGSSGNSGNSGPNGNGKKGKTSSSKQFHLNMVRSFSSDECSDRDTSYWNDVQQISDENNQKMDERLSLLMSESRFQLEEYDKKALDRHTETITLLKEMDSKNYDQLERHHLDDTKQRERHHQESMKLNRKRRMDDLEGRKIFLLQEQRETRNRMFQLRVELKQVSEDDLPTKQMLEDELRIFQQALDLLTQQMDRHQHEIGDMNIEG